MNPLLLGSVLDVGKTIIDRLIPDKESARQAEIDLIKLAADGELKQVLAQLEINAREAQSQSVFVAGWRPAAGWCCVIGFGYTTLLHPMLSWFSSVKGYPAPPAIEADLLMLVLTGMLGIGGLRTFEKYQGVASK